MSTIDARNPGVTAAPASSPGYKTAARRSPVAVGGRKGDLAAIHIAKQSLGMDDDHYRDLMATVCGGIRSAAELDFTGRKRFLEHLQACLRAHGRVPRERVIKAPLSPAQRKMWALWMQLADAKLVQERTMAALAAWATRQTGVQRLEWLNEPQEALVLASLRRWLKERG